MANERQMTIRVEDTVFPAPFAFVVVSRRVAVHAGHQPQVCGAASDEWKSTFSPYAAVEFKICTLVQEE
jgi:hypothetical protein